MRNITNIIQYAKGMNAQDDVISWIEKTYVAYLNNNPYVQQEIEHIIDYMCSDARPKRVSKMSYEQAKTNTDKWVKKLIKEADGLIESESDTEVFMDFGDGFKIVRLIGKTAYEREGNLMRHCVASYYGNGKTIYSLRDGQNNPHCTIEENRQIKGKGNGSIHPKYVGYVVKFLEKIGMRVCDSEMNNLGYVNAEKIYDKLHKTKNKMYGKYILKDSPVFNLDGEPYCDLDLMSVIPCFDIIEDKVIWNIKLNPWLENAIKNATKNLNVTSSGYNSRNASSGNDSRNASSGNDSRNASSGYGSHNASSGNDSQNASSGYGSHNASSGNYSRNASSGYNSHNASSGYDSHNASSGYGSHNASSGNYSHNASSGYGSHNASSGNYSHNASSGNYSRNASSGYGSHNASSGNYSHNASSGNNSHNASSGNMTYTVVEGSFSVTADIGIGSCFKGVNGTVFALCHYVEDKPVRIVSGVVGENGVKENVFYTLDSDGNLIEKGE